MFDDFPQGFCFTFYSYLILPDIDDSSPVDVVRVNGYLFKVRADLSNLPLLPLLRQTAKNNI